MKLLCTLLWLALSASLVQAQTTGVGGWVSGDIQKVGFRAFILRQAIAQNLGGWTRESSRWPCFFLALRKSGSDPAGSCLKLPGGPDRSAVKALQT